jgi:hypothetical protein
VGALPNTIPLGGQLSGTTGNATVAGPVASSALEDIHVGLIGFPTFLQVNNKGQVTSFGPGNSLEPVTLVVDTAGGSLNTDVWIFRAGNLRLLFFSFSFTLPAPFSVVTVELNLPFVIAGLGFVKGCVFGNSAGLVKSVVCPITGGTTTSVIFSGAIPLTALVEVVTCEGYLMAVVV